MCPNVCRLATITLGRGSHWGLAGWRRRRGGGEIRTPACERAKGSERESRHCASAAEGVCVRWKSHNNRRNLHLSVFIPMPVETDSPEIALLCFFTRPSCLHEDEGGKWRRAEAERRRGWREGLLGPSLCLQ